jgi:hypothetical protein
MPSITVVLADTNVHNLKDLLAAAKTLPAYEFREMTILADDGNAATILYVGGADVSNTGPVDSYQLQAGASKTYNPKGFPGQLYYTSTIYVKASAGLTFHFEGTY